MLKRNRAAEDLADHLARDVRRSTERSLPALLPLPGRSVRRRSTLSGQRPRPARPSRAGSGVCLLRPGHDRKHGRAGALVVLAVLMESARSEAASTRDYREHQDRRDGDVAVTAAHPITGGIAPAAPPRRY
jgi:hypothetical protein